MIGTKDDLVSLEEQFLAGVDTPDFLPPVSSEEETDGIATEPSVFLNSTPANVTSEDVSVLNSTPVNKGA